MTAFGISARPYQNASTPGIEVVDVYGDSTNTYVAKILGSVSAVQITPRSSGVTAIPSYSVSGRTVTVTSTGMSGIRLTLTLYGE